METDFTGLFLSVFVLLMQWQVVTCAMPSLSPTRKYELERVDTRVKRHITDVETSCRVFPTEPGMNDSIAELIESGGVQLIEYTIRSNDSAMYDEVVWEEDGGESPLYAPNRWIRVASVHGRALLSLVFNYQVVSLQMLSYGVHKREVELGEDNCTTTEDRTRAIRWLIYNDFNTEYNEKHTGHREVCNQIVEHHPGGLFSRFKQECYNVTKDDKEESHVLVGHIVANKWIDVLHGLLEFVRMVLILFGPLILQSWIYKGDLQSSVPYIVHMEQEHSVELDATPDKRQEMLDDTETTSPIVAGAHATSVPMSRLRSCISKKTTVSHFTMKTKRMNIIVDHTKLMAQSAVPVNLFTFIKDELFSCKILDRKWLKSCSRAGCLFGRCLSTIVPQSDTDFPPKRPSWSQIFKIFASIFVAAVVVPLPFHIRVAMYQFSEADEMDSRLEATKHLNYPGPYYSSFWFGVNWPVAIALIYTLYVVSLVVFAAAQRWFFKAFDDVIQDCIFDLQSVSYSSILSMLFYHLVVPFKEFGFLLGLLFAVPYYICVLPLALMIALFYGLPTFYLIGRLCYNFRPQILEVPIPHCVRRTKEGDELVELDEVGPTRPETYTYKPKTRGSTFSRTFDLDRISPETRLFPRLPVQRLVSRWSTRWQRKIQRHVLSLGMSLTTITLMLMIVVMYAEALRFFLHMILLGLTGLVLNASHTMDYFILCFWTLMYAIQTIKTIHRKYNQMSQHMFSFLKSHLSSDIGDATRVPENFQTFTGFKYFKRDRLQDIKEKMLKYVHRNEVGQFTTDTEDRLVRNEEGNLEWNVHGLVLFVDTQDLPRIPKNLFWKICDELRAPGCPGPLRHSIAEALKQLACMLVFLFIVFIIIMSFHDVFDPSSNNQLLLTVASGFLPLIIRQLIPGSPKVDLSEYSLKGKIEEILLHYRESWPAYDLVEESDSEDSLSDPSHRGDSPDAAPTSEHRSSEDEYLEDDLIDMDNAATQGVIATVGMSEVEDVIVPETVTDVEASPIDMDVIVPEVSTGLGSAPPRKPVEASVVRPETPLAVDVSDTEGSQNFRPHPVRLPRYTTKERLLTFATAAGPKEDSRHILEAVVVDVNERKGVNF